MKTKKVLVFAPHPDDDVIGCGGTIIQHVQNGDEVWIVYITYGEAGSLKIAPEELAKLRITEATAAATVLGVPKDHLQFLGWPDGYLEYNPTTLKKMTSLIRKCQPDTVYLHHEKDLHVDHRVTFRLVTEAVERAAGNCFSECGKVPWNVENVYGYEVWRPMGYVQLVVDISAEIDQKLRALAEHRSQLAELQYDEAVKSLNHYRAIMTHRGQFAECFQVAKITHEIV